MFIRYFYRSKIPNRFLITFKINNKVIYVYDTRKHSMPFSRDIAIPLIWFLMRFIKNEKVPTMKTKREWERYGHE